MANGRVHLRTASWQIRIVAGTRRLLVGREQEVAEMYLAGASLNELANRFHTSEHTISRVLRIAGVQPRPAGRPRAMSRAQEQHAIALYRSGLTCREVASQIDVSVKTVLEAVRRAGALRSHVLEGVEDRIVAAYRAGESMLSLAAEHDV